jgi:hypothetical protein
LRHEPFVPFDLFTTTAGALTLEALEGRLARTGLLRTPHRLHQGGAIGLSPVLALLEAGGGHGADCIEGAVWRIERGEQVLARAKYVRHDKVDGHLLPENTGRSAVWNWQP